MGEYNAKGDIRITNGDHSSDHDPEERDLMEKDPLDQHYVNPEDFTPPDGGWGWVVCFTSFWTNGAVFGILNTFGILYVEIIKEFDTGQADIAFKTSWIGTLQISMTFFLSPVASIMVDKLGIQATGFIGACCATLGMFLSAFVRRMELLYLTYGLLLGIGSSLVYGPSIVILGHYFKRHLGIVNGIASFGSSVFTILISFLEQMLLQRIGLYYTMMILSGLLAVLIPGSLTWKPLYSHKEVKTEQFASTQSLYQPWTCSKGLKNIFNVEIWKNKGYRVWAAALPTAFMGYFIPFVHLVKHTSVVMPYASGSVLVMCLSVTSGVSRLIFGIVADMPKVNRVMMQQFSFIILGCATACIPFAKEFWQLILLALIMGISDGAFICLLGPIAFDLLGPSGAPQGLGFMLGLSSITMTAGPPLAGLVFDYLGSYNIAFWSAGIPPLLGALMLFLVPRNRK